MTGIPTLEMLASYTAVLVFGALLGTALTLRFMRNEDKPLSSDQIQSLRVRAAERRRWH